MTRVEVGFFGEKHGTVVVHFVLPVLNRKMFYVFRSILFENNMFHMFHMLYSSLPKTSSLLVKVVWKPFFSQKLSLKR